MSRFYGTVSGGRSEATRCGHRTTGLKVAAGSYSGGVFVELWVDDQDRDCAHIYIGSWQGTGPSNSITLFHGPLDDASPQSPLAAIVAAAERRSA